MYNEFTWCELTSYSTEEARFFYAGVFGWKFDASIHDYTICGHGNEAHAGIIPMSEDNQLEEKLSFWSVMISVDRLADTVDLAITLGAKVVSPTRSSESEDQYVILCDPMGGRFMLHEGNRPFRSKDRTLPSQKLDGFLLGSELHVNSLVDVSGFYERLLDWEFVVDDHFKNRYLIYDRTPKKGSKSNDYDKKLIGSALEIGREMENITKTNDWIVTFGVIDINQSIKKAESLGGLLIMELTEYKQSMALIQDVQGAMFMIREV